MPSPYIPSSRPKYPRPENGLRQLNIRADESTFARLLQLKEQAGDTGTIGGFARRLFAQWVAEQSTAVTQW